MSAQVAADLRAAADVLERDGWTYGSYRDAYGRCVNGALLFVASDGAGSSPRFLDYEQYPRFQAARERLLAEVGDVPATWNDAPGRTAAEVIAVLRAAAARAEATP